MNIGSNQVKRLNSKYCVAMSHCRIWSTVNKITAITVRFIIPSAHQYFITLDLWAFLRICFAPPSPSLFFFFLTFASANLFRFNLSCISFRVVFLLISYSVNLERNGKALRGFDSDYRFRERYRQTRLPVNQLENFVEPTFVTRGTFFTKDEYFQYSQKKKNFRKKKENKIRQLETKAIIKEIIKYRLEQKL